ncbi:ribonuclease H-like domain-containing protein [Tanacetum coccineum]
MFALNVDKVSYTAYLMKWIRRILQSQEMVLNSSKSRIRHFVNDFYENSEFNSEVKELPVNIVRRSSRQTKLPTSLNDFIIDGEVKYGVEKVTNYANLNLEEDVYMTIPQRFADKDNKNKVCKLVKSFYGLKQAPRKWNEKLVVVLKENGFVQSPNDLFTKSKHNKFIVLLVYVDDIVVTSNFIKTKDDLCLSQRKYYLELLKEYGLLRCKPVSTLMKPNFVLPYVATSEDHLLDNITGYQKLLGKLIYLTHTRPDISYFVHCLAHYMHSPLKSHLNCELNVLRSSYARAMIELRADVELKDTILSPKKIVSDVVKNMNNPKQATRGVLVGPKVGFKSTKQIYTPVSIKNDASTSGKKKQAEVSRQEVSNSNPFDMLNSIENDDDLDGNPLVPTGNVDSESEVKVVFDETTNLMTSTSFKGGSDRCYGINSLLEQWRKSKRDDYYDPYDDDLYKNHDMSNHLQAICDDLDITDRWTWTLNASGDFSVASVRNLIDTTMLPKGEYQTRWIRVVPIKVNTFAWKVMTNSLPTRFNISRRGIDIDSISCGNCDLGVETSNHLFFTCDMAKQITRLIMRWWDVPELEIDSYNDWRNWIVNVRMPSKNKDMFEGVLEKHLEGIHMTWAQFGEEMEEKTSFSFVTTFLTPSMDVPRSAKNKAIMMTQVIGKHLERIHVTWTRFGEEMEEEDKFELLDHLFDAFTDFAQKVLKINQF